MCARLKGKKCLNPSREGKLLLVYKPFRRGKKTLCTFPTGEGKTPCVQSLQEGEKTPLCTVSKCIYPRSMFPTQPKPEVVPVRIRLRRLLPKWKNQKVHQSNCHSENAQNYPGFPASPASTQVSDKQNALLTCIQDLL